MTIRLCFMVLLALAGCGDKKPSPEACSDFRVMTYLVRNSFGWSLPETRVVCVIRERPVETPR